MSEPRIVPASADLPESDEPETVPPQRMDTDAMPVVQPEEDELPPIHRDAEDEAA